MTIKIPSPEKMQKYPWATTAVSLFAVCALLLGVILKKPDGCEADKILLREENALLRTQKDDLVQALLVKNGIIDEIKKSTDSLVREKIGTEATILRKPRIK